MEYLLTTDCLTKQYGKQKAVNGVNIHVRQGDIYGLIGRNGAGKTTILKIISGLAAPTSGSFSIFGESGKYTSQCMSRIGTLIETPGIYPNMSATENLKLKCLAMGVRKFDVIDELLKNRWSRRRRKKEGQTLFSRYETTSWNCTGAYR